MKKIIKIVLLTVVVSLLNFSEIWAQCAMCRTTVENNVSNGDFGIAAGLNLGILYLFVVPYIAIAAVAFFWYKRSKANAKKISLESRAGM